MKCNVARMFLQSWLWYLLSLNLFQNWKSLLRFMGRVLSLFLEWDLQSLDWLSLLRGAIWRVFHLSETGNHFFEWTVWLGGRWAIFPCVIWSEHEMKWEGCGIDYYLIRLFCKRLYLSMNFNRWFFQSPALSGNGRHTDRARGRYVFLSDPISYNQKFKREWFYSLTYALKTFQRNTTPGTDGL